jgi:hypothetical protein
MSKLRFRLELNFGFEETVVAVEGTVPGQLGSGQAAITLRSIPYKP